MTQPQGARRPGPIRSDESDGRSMIVLARDIASVAAARRWVTTFLNDHRVEAARIRDAALVVSELVTNALRHGLGDVVARGTLSDEGEIMLSVTDSGAELPVVLPPDLNRIGGLGLHIVDQLTNRWGVTPFPGGKTVWATFDANTTG